MRRYGCGVGVCLPADFEAENLQLTMRSEEKENFRPVSPMMMAVVCDDYAENCRRITNQYCVSESNDVEWPLCLKWERRAKL